MNTPTITSATTTGSPPASTVAFSRSANTALRGGVAASDNEHILS